MLLLRYVYVLALSIWFGGIITVAAIVAPLSDASVRRFYQTSYVSGALVLITLFGMALLGPRPSGFFARFGVAVAMFALTLYAGLHLQTVSVKLAGLIAAAGLALLFWEARDGTRAA